MDDQRWKCVVFSVALRPVLAVTCGADEQYAVGAVALRPVLAVTCGADEQYAVGAVA